jgi:hypothetical protein
VRCGVRLQYTRKIVEMSSLAYFAGGLEEAKEAVRTNNDFGNFHAKLEQAPVEIAFFADKRVTQLAAGYSFR